MLFFRKPSYSSSPVVWIKQSGIQTDIQKVNKNPTLLRVQYYRISKGLVLKDEIESFYLKK